MAFVVISLSIHQVKSHLNSTSIFDTVNFNLLLLEKMGVKVIYWLISSNLCSSTKDDFLSHLFHYSLICSIYFSLVIYSQNLCIQYSNHQANLHLKVWPGGLKFYLLFISLNLPYKVFFPK